MIFHNKSRHVSLFFSRHTQRLTALFLCLLITISVIFPPVAALAATTSAPPISITNNIPHKTPTQLSIGTINPNSSGAPQIGGQSPFRAATDATPTHNSNTPNLAAVGNQIPTEPLTVPKLVKQNVSPHELANKRTAVTSQFINKDASITQTNYVKPHFYQNNGEWDTIDSSLIKDSNPSDANNIVTQALSTLQSLIKAPNAYTVRSNSWQARFGPSDFGAGMVRIKQGASQVGYSPLNANVVNPVITTDATGKQTVHYDNLWPGIDVTYLVESDQVKEAIILKDKSAASSVQFKLLGADLQRSSDTSVTAPAFTIHGALGDQFTVLPANLIMNSFGFTDPKEAGLFQTYVNGIYKVGIDPGYLQGLPAKAFPAVIDPTVQQSNFGTRAGGNYASFKSDGSVCYSNVCDLYAGSLYDSHNILRYWRGMLYSSYDFLRPSGTVLDNATLHLTQLTGVSWGTGDTNTHTYQVGHAACLNGFDCIEGNQWWASGTIGISGDIPMTSSYQTLVNRGDFGAWLIVGGEDGTTNSWKMFNPDNSYVTFTYHANLAAPTIAQPSYGGQLFVDPQASLKVNFQNNPNGTTPLQYEFMVSDGPNGTGTVIDSGIQNSTVYTVPDGILQDGSNYYVQARSIDPSTGNLTSPWSSSVLFKIDSRKGKDKIQTYDTVGPVSVDLATGNVSTSVASHTSSALAGSLGVNLDYNSSLKSRPGLIGTYWNQSGGSFSNPNLVRADQNVDFDWNAGSPSSLVGNTNFNAQWNGYFVAPVAGSYYFGGVNDDGLSITVNSQQVYSSGCYYGGSACYGSAITLNAGQTVPFQAAYYQGSGPDYVHLYVKGPVAEQIIPQNWLQTGVRPLQQSNGLVGRYASYTDTGSPPIIGNSSNVTFLTRTDPLLSFNWNGGSPIPNGPSNNFLVSWTGNIAVPTTGVYRFGTQSDDGSKVTLRINGTDTTVYNNWQDSGSNGSEGYDQTGVTLTSGQSYPVTVNYYQHCGSNALYLKVYTPGASTPQIVPTSWLSPQTQVVPAGWALGIDPDGNATYTYVTANQNNAILMDSSGDTHTYTWTGSAYKPPTNEYGHLQRNLDGTFTLQDADGKTYIFDSTGNLVSLTSPVDDRQPAALQYTYGPINGTGPTAIQQITDGVNANRWAKVYYRGGACGTIPSGFGVTPINMLCAVSTNDGRTTYFYYDTNGNLTRVARPGNDNTDYQYQSVLNGSSQTIGYQLTGVRDNLANDAVLAGQRSNDNTTYTLLSYDAVGRVASVTLPAASSGASQQSKSYAYFASQTTLGLTRYYNVAVRDHAALINTPSPGYLLENTLGYLNPTGGAGQQALYSCKINSDEFTSSSSTCEGQQAYGGLLGYIYISPPSGLSTQPIYRCTIPGNGYEHFDSLGSNCEGATTEMLLGYALSAPAVRQPAYSDLHVSGAVEPNGFTEEIAYDALFRTIRSTDALNLTTSSVWGTAKDLLYSTTTPTGLTTSTIYDDDDRPISHYGPAPSSWFNTTINGQTGHTDSTPQAAYMSQVPHSDTAYDQNITGLATAYMKLTELSPNSASLTGAPLLHGTNIATDGTISHNWGTTPPVPGYTGNWGISMTGKMRLPTSGIWNMTITSDNGMRLWIDDSLVIDNWKDNPNGSGTVTQTASYNNETANSLRRVRIDYYHLTGAGNAVLALALIPPGGASTTQVASYFTPDYSLATSSTSYDASIGNTTATTSYGTAPELSLAQSTSVDSSGLNLTTASAYETPGSGLLRQTSQTLPGGNATSYSYYSATDTLANPCATNSPAALQAGRLKTKTYPGPTAGSTGKTITYIYDDSGNVVATQTNTDGWDCKTYDARERLVQDVVPASIGQSARTVTSNYNVGGNPLVTSVVDPSGTITTTTDLLGRTVAYSNIFGDTTTTLYDSLGRIQSQTSIKGVETFTYDTYGRLVDEKLGTMDLAQITYDSYNRTDHIDYPSAGRLRQQPGRDALGRTTAVSYNLSSVPGNNLVANPSLETPNATDATKPDQWQSDNWGTNIPSFSYASDGHSGNRSAKTTMSSYTNGDAKWYATPVPITAGTTYTASDYYKSSVLTSLIVQYTPADTSITYQWLGDLPAASTWTQASFTTTAPANAVKASIFHTLAAVGWLQVDDVDLHEAHIAATISDSVTLTQSNRIQSDVVQSGTSSLWSTYGYDTAGRLTSTNIGPHSYSYGFGAQSTSCGTGANMNPNAGKNGNRTTQTIDGTTTTYCYDYADRLVSSSDPTANYSEYDSHGNMTYLGTGNKPLRLCYDSADRNTCLVNYDSSGNGTGMYYNRDAAGRLTYREQDNIAGWNWSLNAQYSYGYTDSSDTPSYVYNNAWQVIEEYLSLPGGSFITIRPQRSGGAPYYTLPNMHGDTFQLTDGTGTNISDGNGPLTSFTYDPFGNPLSGGNLPNDTDYGSFGYEGSHQKLTETTLNLNPMLMGARVYLPTLGRFSSMDPIDGGNANSYGYPGDPVNMADLNGMFGLSDAWNGAGRAVSFGYKQLTNLWAWEDAHPRLTLVLTSLVPGGEGEEGSYRGGFQYKLREKLAIQEAKVNPGRKLDVDVQDPRYKGLQKMTYAHSGKDGNNVEVHYWRNPITGKRTGYKIKRWFR